MNKPRTSAPVATGEAGPVCAPQQPARDARGCEVVGFERVCSPGPPVAASGSGVLLHCGSSAITSGGVRSPPLAIDTAQPAPSGFAVTFALSGPSRTTCLPCGAVYVKPPLPFVRQMIEASRMPASATPAQSLPASALDVTLIFGSVVVFSW